MKKHLFAALALSAAASLLVVRPARAQEEVPMTPTPTPAVSPIPSYPEKHAGAGAAAASEPSPLATGVRIDRAGMFGAGLGVGNTMTGATAKLWFSPDVAAQFGVGSGPFGNNVRFQLDLLYTFYRFDSEDGQYSLPFYLGLGGQTGIFFKYPYPADRTDIGMRIPFGMSVVIPNNPVELFFEIAPDAGFYDDTIAKKQRGIFYVDGQIGARFYF